MIAASIGRTFLNAWNEKYQKEYSTKEFFESEFIPLFFDHPKYLMTGGNSPLENPKITWKKGITPSADEREDRIKKTIEKIYSNSCDASIALGFPASEDSEFATTSGLVTDMDLKYSPDDKMLSWIGGGLGVGVAGGYSIFFDHPQILLTLYDGWKIYRKFLNDPTLNKLAGNKINSWNGQWLGFSYSVDYEENPDFGLLSNCNFFKQDEKEIVIDTIFWTKLYFNLSETLSDETVTVYVYSLGQTNKTIGFIPFRFHQGRSILSIYKILFGENDALTQKKDYENMFGIHIKRACELGTIGLQALEPHGLREYFDKAKMPDFSTTTVTAKNGEVQELFEERKKKANQNNYENIISFRTYKTWLLAMITKNKQEDLHYSEEVAIALKKYRADAKKRDRANLLENELLQAKTKKQFLDGLATLIKDVDPNLLETFKTLRDKVHLMTAEDFGYFVVLLKFDYAYQEKNS